MIKDRPHWFKNETKYYNYFLPAFGHILKNNLINLKKDLYPSNYWKLMMFVDATFDRDVSFRNTDELTLKLFEYNKKTKKNDFFYIKKTNNLNLKFDITDYTYQIPTYLKAQVFGLSEMLFFRNHDFIYNVHGPYKVNNYFILVYDFNLFSIPQYISNKIHPDLKKRIVTNFSICSLYSELDAEIDIFNNLNIKKSKHIKDICNIDLKTDLIQELIINVSTILDIYSNKDFYLQELDIFWEIINYSLNLNEQVPNILKEIDINEIFI